MIIAPSLLAANHGKLASEIQRIDRAGADWAHLDIMDGHFVPNLTFGPRLVECLRPLTRMPLDVHLMCTKPEIVLPHFVKAGADNITVHCELQDKVTSLLWDIRSHGKKAGLAINPATPFSMVEPYLNKIDLLLIMTVNPGFGGQSFIEEVVPKIQKADRWRIKNKLKYHIEVDGGINYNTMVSCVNAGADAIVSGTTLFASGNLKTAIARMRKIAIANFRKQGEGK